MDHVHIFDGGDRRRSTFRLVVGLAMFVCVWLGSGAVSRATVTITVAGVIGSGETFWTFGGSGDGVLQADREVYPFDPAAQLIPDQIIFDVPNIWVNIGDFATNAQFDETALSFIGGGGAQIIGSVSGPVGIGSIYLDSDGTGLGRDDLYWFVADEHTFVAGETFTYSGTSTLPVDLASFDEIGGFPTTLGATFNTGLPGAPTHRLEWNFVEIVPIPEPGVAAMLLLGAVGLQLVRRRSPA